MQRNSTSRQRPNHDAPEAIEASWESAYMGFVMIVLCFFVMLASHSSMQRGKLREFARAIENALGAPPGGQGLLPGEELSANPEPPQALPDPARELESLFATLRDISRRHGLAGEIALTISDRGPVMRLSENALFASGSADIAPAARPMLRQMAAQLAAHAWDLRIEGHTDDVPMRAVRYPSNWELSTARAVNVLRLFLQEARFDSTRLSAVGYGQEHPLHPNASAWGRARNRRVEILFVQPRERAAGREAGP